MSIPEGMALHQILHLLEAGGIILLFGLVMTALKRPKVIIKGIVKEINDMQLKGGK